MGKRRPAAILNDDDMERIEVALLHVFRMTRFLPEDYARIVVNNLRVLQPTEQERADPASPKTHNT